MVNVGTGTIGTRFVRRDWPIEEGLTAGTQKQEGRKTRLEARDGSNIEKKDMVGIE